MSMYKVKKEVGIHANIFLVNDATMAEINLGRLTNDICAILAKDGYAISTIGVGLDPKGAFRLDVSTEVASELARLAMPMKKPNRSKKPAEEKEPKEYADAYDIIFG